MLKVHIVQKNGLMREIIMYCIIKLLILMHFSAVAGRDGVSFKQLIRPNQIMVIFISMV